MTRINVIEPSRLSDKHLGAEGLCYRPNKSGLKITHFTRDFDRLLTMVKQIIL